MINFSPAPFHRRRLILDLARRIQFTTVLDVGCGNGALLEALQQSFSAKLTGIDVSEYVITENAKRLRSCYFRHLDISRAALEDKFDLVICSEVLEHIADQDSAVSNLRSMCKRYLILTVPGEPMFPLDRHFGHVRHYTARSLVALLQKHGIAPVVTLNWGFPFHTLYKHLINLNPQSSMRRFAHEEYGPIEKLTSFILRFLFYFNLRRGGLQIVCLGRVREG